MMEKSKDKKDFSFLDLCLVGRIKSEKMKNFLIWLEREMGE